MRSVIRWFVVVASLVFLPSFQSYAWNAAGHSVIARIAYQRLKPEVRAQVDKMTADLGKEYPFITQFQQMAPWPDMLRSQRIQMYKHWHYIDVAFSDDGTPLKDLSDNDNAVWALRQIAPIIGNPNANPFEKARFLAFLVHIAGDLHQPLHTVSRISATNPKGDHGGNLYYVQYKGYGSHANLHTLWDNGLGLLNVDTTDENIEALAQSITKHYPESYFGNATLDTKPANWANEGYKLGTTVVYKTPSNQTVSTSYVETGRKISEQRLALAGYRLATILNQLLDKKVTHS